jgi:hypothetical protein
MHNLRKGLLKKSKLAQYACEEGHQICCKLKLTGGIEVHGISSKMVCLTKSISQPSSEIFPRLFPLVSKEFSKLCGTTVGPGRFFMFISVIFVGMSHLLP